MRFNLLSIMSIEAGGVREIGYYKQLSCRQGKETQKCMGLPAFFFSEHACIYIYVMHDFGMHTDVTLYSVTSVGWADCADDIKKLA